MDKRENGRANGLSLLFPKGARPDIDAIRALAAQGGGFSISHAPGNGLLRPDGEDSGNWVELLTRGLTFDLAGLGEGVARERPDCAYRFDVPDNLDLQGLEAISLHPGPHLSGGERMKAVVQAMAGLAASLCALDSLAAVAWHPARSYIGPRYFASIVSNWHEGGVFPALGLVGLARSADGGMQSEGVAYFTGQELRIEPELAEDGTAARKIAARLIDHLVENGPLKTGGEISGPFGQALRIEPSANQRFVRVWSG
ncbi:MAG: hypothetical protein PHE36_06345 [Novosphingobium sp.]|nr:hypothetical protein [Novosphingobium sp.]